jgi:hypothetical protein
MRVEIGEIRAAGALQIAAALAQQALIEQRGVELLIESARLVQPRLRVRAAAETVEGDGVVIRGVRAERRVLVGE